MPIKAKGVSNIFITTIMGIICDNLLLAFRRKHTNQPMDINAPANKLISCPGNRAKRKEIPEYVKARATSIFNKSND